MICNIRKYVKMVVMLLVVALTLPGCAISYKFNGASIDYATIHSISVADFPNNAPMVYPSLSNDLSEGIRNIYERQTRLSVLRRGGDLELEGEIIGYDLAQLAVSADSYAAESKLTLTVRVRYTNNINPEESFEKSYSSFQTFSANKMLSDVQGELCETMIKEIAENIYNDTVAKW